ncbi:bud site selection protein [Boothiomyces sp. JEL0838]|nr:bud site selection protein [Boothiomyces sp. JEL0838]
MATMYDVFIEIKNRRVQVEKGQYQYQPKLIKLLNDVVKEYKPTGDPIQETHIVEVLYAFDSLKAFLDNYTFLTFAKTVSKKVIENYEQSTAVNKINNFQSHRVKILSTCGLVLKDYGLMDIAEQWMANQLKENLRIDGSCLDFELRDSLTYVTYNLDPLLIACVNISLLTGNNFYSYEFEGRSILKSVHWLIPYIRKEKQNTMFLKTVYESDKKKKEYGKTKKKKKTVKNQSVKIIDDEAEWGIESEEDVPYVVEQVDHEAKFKRQIDSWEVIREGEGNNSPVNEEDLQVSPKQSRRSPVKSRRSPSASPVRGRRSPSASPVKGRRSPSISPVRGRRSPSPSPERNRKSPSLSPKRRRRSPSASPVREKKSRRSPTPEDNPQLKMSDGSYAGLQTRKDISLQIQKERQNTLMQLEKPEQGKTVYRDITGKKIDVAQEKADRLAEQRRKDAEEEAKMEWGRGLAQRKEKQDMQERLEREKNRGLAIYSDDEELNNELKSVVRWGDTMATAVKKKKSKKYTYKGFAPPNRFGILPGYRWDGVDRSNGWEVKVFQHFHDEKSHQAEYHRWATEDM